MAKHGESEIHFRTVSTDLKKFLVVFFSATTSDIYTYTDVKRSTTANGIVDKTQWTITVYKLLAHQTRSYGLVHPLPLGEPSPTSHQRLVSLNIVIGSIKTNGKHCRILKAKHFRCKHFNKIKQINDTLISIYREFFWK